MKLLMNKTSPFARIAHAALIEAGLSAHLELRIVDHWGGEPLLTAANSAGRIPCLVLDDGTAISESLLIALHAQEVGEADLFGGGAKALAIAGMALGIADAAVQTLVGRRILSGNFTDPAFDGTEIGFRRSHAMSEGLKRLDAKVAADDGPIGRERPDIAAIAAITALDYVRLCFPQADFVSHLASLDRLAERFAQAESIRSTKPALPS